MQKKENFLTDNPDIEFQLRNRINYEEVFEWLSAEERDVMSVTNGEEFKNTAVEVLEALGDICGSVVAPNARAVEEEHPEIKDGDVVFGPKITENINSLIEFGVAGLSAHPKYGGMGAPFFLETAALEMIHRACPSTGLNIVWYSSIAHVIQKFGTQDQQDRVNDKIATGQWSGCMALTEPDAGSDLGAVRTYGERQEDGTYKLHGTKRFISNGCGQVALVLGMKEKGAVGLENLSLYLCLRKNEDGSHNYSVSKLEEKLALPGSATCEMNFDGSHAELIGEEGKGFKYMLKLMNDARIATAFQGIGMMEASLRLAQEFASQRKTWGKPIAHHEMIAEKLLDMEVDTKALRSLCYQAAYNQSMMYLGEAYLKNKELSESDRKEVEKKVAKYRKRVRRWTPLVKWYGAERAVSMARDCVQIHGGYGFSKEYRAEFWYRESMILPLYEGTSQIQALMTVKDTMKEVIRQPRAFVEYYMGHKIKSLAEGDKLRRNLYKAKQIINSGIVSLLMQLVKLNAAPTINKPGDITKLIRMVSKNLIKMENISPALLHAERLCEMKALVAMAETLVWDAEADSSRRWIAERFLNKSLPKLAMLKEEMETVEPIIGERLEQLNGQGDKPSEAAVGAN
jgi:alkylation response protein AidB-like acyl-CoA dehydrogenase